MATGSDPLNYFDLHLESPPFLLVQNPPSFHANDKVREESIESSAVRTASEEFGGVQIVADQVSRSQYRVKLQVRIPELSLKEKLSETTREFPGRLRSTSGRDHLPCRT
jgi:hypothetical protein